MYWTLELASKMEDAPWPATKDELLEWAMRVGLQQPLTLGKEKAVIGKRAKYLHAICRAW